MLINKIIAFLMCLISFNAFSAITISTHKDINFGTILPYGIPAILIVNPDGSYNDPQGIVQRSQGIQPASFVVTSTTKNVDLFISTPNSFTLSNGINTLTVTNVTNSWDGVYQLSGKNKRAKLTVGGTMNIPAGYISGGDYQGTLTISVDY